MKGRKAILSMGVALLFLVACGRETPTPTPEAPTPPPQAITPTPIGEPTAETVPVQTEEPTAEPAPEEAPLYLAIIWHQHQPVYFKDPETGIYQKPWVRLHAAKDYVDMAAILEAYPDIRVTFNLTPSLLRQLMDLESGAQDLYEVHTLIPAAELTDDQKTFIVSRFFDINPKIIARFPRYQQIAGDRDNSADWDPQTWLDLQVLFNLGWTDPAWLEEEPLAGLVAQGRDFAEEDKSTVLGEHADLVAQVIPLHRRLQDEGQIEVTMTPFFHPILPLLLDSDLARVAVPDIDLPPRYTYGFDALAQVGMGVDFYTDLFGRPPQGMWPAEGAVAQGVVDMIAREGLLWMASDEEVLARSLGQASFGRDSQEVVQDADALYRPYIVSSRDRQMAIIFRDKVISDKVGFTYSGTPGAAAAQDFIDRMLAIRARLEASGGVGPHLVSVILDGENAWEHYPNDGKEFLHTLYWLLGEEQEKGTLRTTTPAAFIAQFPEQPAIEELWAGSWVSPDYLTWIGEAEENRAWDYLGRVRGFVEGRKHRLDEETRAAVMDAIYAAEGSDWFWWYGADQNSGDDAGFDLQFRLTLGRVYELMHEPIPSFLRVPLIAQEAQAPTAGASGLIAPEVDGVISPGEWDGGGYYLEEGGVQATPSQVVSQLWYGFDKENLFLRLDGRRSWEDIGDQTLIGFYLTRPGGQAESPFSRVSLLSGAEETLLGFGAHLLLEVLVADDAATAIVYSVDGSGAYREVPAEVQVALSGTTLELAIPYTDLGKPDAGDTLRLRAVVSEGEQRDIQVVPAAGPAALLVPDLGLTAPILTVVDPEGDDHGPGSYTYPSDGVFGSRAYDLTEFAVAEDDRNLIFRFTFAGPLNNSWGAPNGMGIHTLDIYLDAAEGGQRTLLPGRNAAMSTGNEWEFAIWAEGWYPGLFGPSTADSPEPVPIGDADTLTVISDPGQGKITIRVPKAVLAESLGVGVDELDPAGWGYLGVVLGQEGYPASGVWRVRDVEAAAQQWRFGGGPADINHTRIIDLAWPEGQLPTQEEMLKGYTSVSEGDLDDLGPGDFAQLFMAPVQ
jgi:alpha-amylase/alpha-mannosidase (GH57 family)